MTTNLLVPLLVLASLGAEPDRPEIVIADFEANSYGEWQSTGTAFGSGPASGEKLHIPGHRGRQLVNSFGTGDPATGTLTSPSFLINRRFVSFLISGGRLPGETGIELLINNESVASATGEDAAPMRWESWDVSRWQGQQARLRIYDRATGGWGHINVDQIVLADRPRYGDGGWRLDEYRRSAGYYQERFRPQFHFTPELNWMNDPNGLVFFDGEYHLFYQHNPLGNEWGHMSWGHAVSRDLLHWQHLPIALRDEYGVMIFSGSAVVDQQNTSGLGQSGQPPLVAIYTGHGHGLQTQDIAFSHDRGRNWIKYAGNPVINLREKEFRDPKVIWHAATKRWVMVVSLAVQKRLQFYGSPNLKDWTLLSEFGPAGVKEKPNWECPDLFELPIQGEPGQSRWVLKADMGNGAIAGGSGGEYFTGVFDGQKFTPDSLESQWIDFGRDFYAPVSWSDIPASDGRRIWLGWMNNWETCLNPTDPWRSAMSIPRQLSLRRINGRLRLCQAPIDELNGLRSPKIEVAAQDISPGAVPVDHRSRQCEIVLEIAPQSAQRCGVRVLAGPEGFTEIGYDREAQTIYVDRTKSGNVAFHPAFAGRHSGPLTPDKQGRIRLRIFVDASSVEVFGNDGETVITDLVFPPDDHDRIEFFA
ncbi:MAG: glycoside hydrolase family 32 protein, partial [Planctomycetes bacterium]|nr:glycoside hydrolase family 32 protein [Planctomycetota bacterium]